MILVVSLTHYIIVTLLLTGMAGPCTAGLHPNGVNLLCRTYAILWLPRKYCWLCDCIVVNNYQGTITRHNEQA